MGIEMREMEQASVLAGGRRRGRVKNMTTHMQYLAMLNEDSRPKLPSVTISPLGKEDEMGPF